MHDVWSSVGDHECERSVEVSALVLLGGTDSNE